MTPPRSPAAGRARRLDLARRDRGSAAVEFALAVPMLVLILATLTQVLAWGMGFLAAHAAADHALQTTRVAGGTTTAGQNDATQLLTQLGGRLIADPAVAVNRGAATTTVSIRGRAHGLPLPINVTVQAPTERYTP